MSDNTMTVLVVFIVLVFSGWVIAHCSKMGLFKSDGLILKAKFAYRLVRTARTPGERLIACAIGFFVLTRSTLAAIFALLLALGTLIIAGALKYDPFKDILDFARSIASFFQGSPFPSAPEPPVAPETVVAPITTV